MTASVGGLQGVWVDLLNPLNEDFSISHKKLSTHVKTLGAKGVAGIVMFGHGGEGQAFSAMERLEAVKQMMAHGVAGKDILLHVGFSSLMDSVQLIRAVQPLGLQGCIVTPPLAEGSITDTGLAEYFIQIAKNVQGAGVRLYLCSLVKGGRTDLKANVITDILRQAPGVYHGLIDQSHNASHTNDWIRSFMATLPVLSTQDLNAHAMANLGIHASISSYANLVPELMVKLVQSSAAQKVSVTGNKIGNEDERLEQFARLFAGLPVVPSLKFLMALQYRDTDWMRVRPPRSELSRDSHEQLAKEFKKFNQTGAAH
jgi:4-hydroxy-tetrahydrodipicolinate synthase